MRLYDGGVESHPKVSGLVSKVTSFTDIENLGRGMMGERDLFC